MAGECSPTSSSTAADGKAAGFGRCQGCDGPRSFCSGISIPSLLLVVKGNVCFASITTVLSSMGRLCLVRTVQRCQGSSMDDPPAMKRSRVPIPSSLRQSISLLPSHRPPSPHFLIAEAAPTPQAQATDAAPAAPVAPRQRPQSARFAQTLTSEK